MLIAQPLNELDFYQTKTLGPQFWHHNRTKN